MPNLIYSKVQAMLARDRINDAAQAHSDNNVFALIVSVLEGGHVFTQSANKTKDKLIKLCKTEQQSQRRAYAKQVAVISREAGRT